MDLTPKPDSIEVLLKEQRRFPPPLQFQLRAHIKSLAEYEKLYNWSVDDPDGFWSKIAEENITWSKKWERDLDYDFLNDIDKIR